jgi:hypothetical protein
MESFLNKGIRILNNLENPFDKKMEKDYGKELLSSLKFKDHKTLLDRFDIGMRRNFDVFGKNAFRISLQNKQRSPINKSLFETWGGLLAALSDKEFQKILSGKDALVSKYDEVKKDDYFYRAVSRDSWKKPNVDFRFNIISDLIKGHI